MAFYPIIVSESNVSLLQSTIVFCTYMYMYVHIFHSLTNLVWWVIYCTCTYLVTSQTKPFFKPSHFKIYCRLNILLLAQVLQHYHGSHHTRLINAPNVYTQVTRYFNNCTCSLNHMHVQKWSHTFSSGQINGSNQCLHVPTANIHASVCLDNESETGTTTVVG